MAAGNTAEPPTTVPSEIFTEGRAIPVISPKAPIHKATVEFMLAHSIDTETVGKLPTAKSKV